jgi:hypothetical protein
MEKQFGIISSSWTPTYTKSQNNPLLDIYAKETLAHLQQEIWARIFTAIQSGKQAKKKKKKNKKQTANRADE